MFRKKKTDSQKKSPKKKETEKKLFGEEPISANDYEDEDLKQDKRDKIFGNDYNTGNIGMDSLPDLKIDLDYSSTYLDSCYNAEDYIERKNLDEKIIKLFSESRWSNYSVRKKFPKDHLPHIFVYLKRGLTNQGHTSVDIFIAIADFLDVTYDKLYDLIGVKHKGEILAELEKKYKVLSSKKEKKLF